MKGGQCCKSNGGRTAGGGNGLLTGCCWYVVLRTCLRYVPQREREGKVEESSKSLTICSVCTYFFHSVLPLIVTAQTLHDRWLIVSLL